MIGENLTTKKDKREEAKAYDDFAVGLCKDVKDSSGGYDVLVGHVPIELSHPVCTFLNAEDIAMKVLLELRLSENGL